VPAPKRPAAPYYGTDIEVRVQALLEELGVNFLAQHDLLPNLRVDFFLPDHGVMIECHGTYFHADPRFCGPGKKPLNAAQRRKRRADAALARFIEATDWRLLVLWEHDIINDPPGCRQQITEMIAVKRETYAEEKKE
jgi:G:T-mismatch repair DNA endonuclease (very short patch repair protein)